MILNNLESLLAKEWIQNQPIKWRVTRNFNRKDCKLTCSVDRVSFNTIINHELTKCQNLKLITVLESNNLITMLNSKNEDDINLGRRLLANLRTRRLKLK